MFWCPTILSKDLQKRESRSQTLIIRQQTAAAEAIGTFRCCHFFYAAFSTKVPTSARYLLTAAFFLSGFLLSRFLLCCHYDFTSFILRAAEFCKIARSERLAGTLALQMRGFALVFGHGGRDSVEPLLFCRSLLRAELVS